MYHGKPAKKGKPTADELDAEMDAYNKAAATGAVAAEAADAGARQEKVPGWAPNREAREARGWAQRPAGAGG